MIFGGFGQGGILGQKIDNNIMKAIYLCIATIIVLAVTSCAGAKKKRAHRYFNENKKELAELCIEKFPIQKEYIKGDTITITDTLKVIDTLPIKIPCPDGNVVDCPPKQTKYVTITKTVTDTIVKIDTRNEYLLEEKIKKGLEDNRKLKNWNKRLVYTSVSLLLLLIVSRILK